MVYIVSKATINFETLVHNATSFSCRRYQYHDFPSQNPDTCKQTSNIMISSKMNFINLKSNIDIIPTEKFESFPRRVQRVRGCWQHESLWPLQTPSS